MDGSGEKYDAKRPPSQPDLNDDEGAPFVIHNNDGTVDEIEQIIVIDNDDENDQDQNYTENGQYDMDDDEPDQTSDQENEDGEDEMDDYRDDAVAVFAGHGSKDVFAVDVHEGMVTSGGEDDRAVIHACNTPATTPICELTSFNDSVVFVRFNKDGKLLAAGDMSGKIVINRIGSVFETVVEFDDASDLEWMFWHTSMDIVFAGSGDGLVWMWLVANGQSKVFSAGGASACTAGALLSDGKRLVAGYADGSTRIWNLKEAVSVEVTSTIGRPIDAPVVSVAVADSVSLNVGAAGYQNGKLCTFHLDTAQILSTLSQPTGTTDASSSSVIAPSSQEDADPEVSHSVECVAFCPGQHSLLAACSNDGCVNLWDLTNNSLRVVCQHPATVVKCIWLDGVNLASACLDGILRIWDARDGTIVREFGGGGDQIFDLAWCPERKTIATGSANGKCRLFRLE